MRWMQCNAVVVDNFDMPSLLKTKSVVTFLKSIIASNLHSVMRNLRKIFFGGDTI